MSFIKNLLSKPPIEYSEEDRSNLNPMDKAKKIGIDVLDLF